MARPRALLTGRTGFTGRYVASELEREGYDVIGLANHLAGDDLGSTIQVNLLDRDAVARAVAEANADVVLHLAAIAFVAHGDSDEMYRVNVVGTRNLLEALAAAPKRPELVVLASSANVYGNAEASPITEDTPPAPANDYAVSKLAMEYMARLWMDRLPIVITRPFNYTGVGQSEKFLVPKIVGHFKRREPVIELGNIEVFRDFSDVRDIAKAYVRIFDKKPKGSVLNLCSGVIHSLAEILSIAQDLSGHRMDVRVNPTFVRSDEVTRLLGSRQRMNKMLGVTDFHSLEDTINWMLEANYV